MTNRTSDMWVVKKMNDASGECPIFFNFLLQPAICKTRTLNPVNNYEPLFHPIVICFANFSERSIAICLRVNAE